MENEFKLNSITPWNTLVKMIEIRSSFKYNLALLNIPIKGSQRKKEERGKVMRKNIFDL